MILTIQKFKKPLMIITSDTYSQSMDLRHGHWIGYT